MSVSKSNIAAAAKYHAKNNERLNLLIRRGEKDIIRAAAEKNGETLNGFSRRVLLEAANRVDLSHQ